MSIQKFNLNNFICSSLLLLFIAVPEIIFSYYDYSLSLGLCIVATLFFFYSFNSPPFVRKNTLFLYFYIFFILFLQSLYFFLVKDNSKAIISLVLFCFILFSLKLFSNKVKFYNINLIDIMKIPVFILIFLGWISILSPNIFPHPSRFDKFVFPFSEQSHYALSIGFLTVIYGFFQNKKLKIFLFLNILFQAIMFPNLTLLQFSLLCFVVFFMMRNIIVFSSFIILLFLLTFVYMESFNFLSDGYFSSRLSFNNTDNLSTLVYLQGIDDAFNSLITTNGLGLGFQQAGTNEIGKYGRIMYSNYGLILNRDDGGFLASKIIIEFGVIGIVIVFFYVFKFFKSVTNIVTKNSKCIVYDLAILAFFIEMFFRGVGYFSVQLFLLILFMFSCKKNYIY